MPAPHHLEDVVLDDLDRCARLRQALAKLPSDYERTIVILYMLGLTQVEIAGVFGVTRQAIQQQVKRFKRVVTELSENPDA